MSELFNECYSCEYLTRDKLDNHLCCFEGENLPDWCPKYYIQAKGTDCKLYYGGTGNGAI